ncbi:MAG: prepilin-type N-terminal cleavage/methylation domain-containing protein [Desulfacinum sp.]|jgi:prepilin-type N-terminal cleavage/methylation domain-containing protein|nr:prepilin-type N-terminal cleavage/methylation domain-containing protein [Desulfacinum sp.]
MRSRLVVTGPVPIEEDPAASRGFTLMELLMALVLAGLVLVIGAAAFSLVSGHWVRRLESPESVQARIALGRLVSRQVEGLLLPFETTVPALQASAQIQGTLCGGPQEFFLVTTYAPMGSPAQGVVSVFYRFYEAEGELRIYQRSLLRLHEDTMEPPEEPDASNEAGWVVSRVPGVKDFRAEYLERRDTAEGFGAKAPWRKDWPCGQQAEPPGAVRIHVTWNSSGGLEKDDYILPVERP